MDQALSTGREEVSLSSFAFLFSELVQYHLRRVSDTSELERKLEDAGAAVGARIIELLAYREKQNQRETRLSGILTFIQRSVWKCLFGKPADALEVYDEDEFVISDREVLVSRFISVPKDFQGLNCASFVAGVVKGCLESARFEATVSAYDTPTDGRQLARTNILVKFSNETLERDRELG